MSKAIETKIECPFYIKEGQAFIICEGIKTTDKKLYFFNRRRQNKMATMRMLRRKREGLQQTQSLNERKIQRLKESTDENNI